ncbi:MAG: tRNA (adenosine(37)-N6)-threonylcarbamoyltransferase complex ATPase subunit type 1 TsaE [Alphaproteobacteria bacterium]
MRFRSHGEADTEALGRRLGEVATPGLVVCLSGPLGAGKTAFVRGLASGLGVEDGRVHSPSFVTAIEYEGRLRLVHLDLYRHEASLPPADWVAEMLDGPGVAAVEWSERLGADEPADALQVTIEYGASPDERRIEARAGGEGSRRALDAWTSDPGSDGREQAAVLEGEPCAR